MREYHLIGVLLSNKHLHDDLCPSRHIIENFPHEAIPPCQLQQPVFGLMHRNNVCIARNRTRNTNMLVIMVNSQLFCYL